MSRNFKSDNVHPVCDAIMAAINAANVGPVSSYGADEFTRALQTAAGEVFGKPHDRAHAIAMLQRLSGCTHHVLSAVWCTSAGREERAFSITEVSFAILSAAQIAGYVDSGESLDKAGAYAVQGRAAAFISHLSGSYSGVMGLPLYETIELLRRFGIAG